MSQENQRAARSYNALPANLSPRGVCREAAASYIGISASKFDEMVRLGKMPSPKRIGRRKLWDIRAIDFAFEQLEDECKSDNNPWENAE
jgi:predicted DNA-binding transcriptional regulator AlpA